MSYRWFDKYVLIFFCRSKDSSKTKAMTIEKETDVEQLCKVIYDNGEQYMDGTAAINFAALKIVRYYVFQFETIWLAQDSTTQKCSLRILFNQ